MRTPGGSVGPEPKQWKDPPLLFPSFVLDSTPRPRFRPGVSHVATEVFGRRHKPVDARDPRAVVGNEERERNLSCLQL